MKGLAFYGEKFFTIKQNSSLYSEAITRIVMTNPGERPGIPFFGVGLRNRLFELMDDNTIDAIKADIKEQTDIYLPQLILTRIETTQVNNSLTLNIGFIENGNPIEDERILKLEFDGIETE